MRTAPLLLLLACTGSNNEDSDTTPVVCDGDDGGAVTMTIAPYLQSVSQTEATVMWETDEGSGSRLEFGSTDALGGAACGVLVGIGDDDPEDAPTVLHSVTLTDLEPGQTVLSQDEIRQRLEAKGHKVQRLKMDDGCYEVYLTDAEGARREAYVHPATAVIVRSERDD